MIQVPESKPERRSDYNLVMTPGFMDLLDKDDHLVHKALRRAVDILVESIGSEPSWVVTSPDDREESEEDGGRTRKIPCETRFWVIRDDHPRDCDCGCEGKAIITALLPEEY